MNWDDWAARYNRYKVMASSIHVRAMTLASSTLSHVVVHPSNVAASLSTQEAEALPWAKFFMINNTKQMDCRHSMKSPVIDGSLPGQFMGRESVDALTTTVPSDQWFWHITQSSYDHSTSCVAYYEVNVVYDITFYDRLDPRMDLMKRMVALRDARTAHLAKMGKTERKNRCVVNPVPVSGLETKKLGFLIKDISVKTAGASDTFVSKSETPAESKSVTEVKTESKASGLPTVFTMPKASQRMKLVIEDDERSGDLCDYEDDQDEAEFLAYLKAKFKARAAQRQAHAFENADFSGSGRTTGLVDI
jgi:hypothetical protein